MSATFAALVVSAMASLPPRPGRQQTAARFVLDTTLTTRTARRGESVPLRAADAFVIDGTGIPAGSRAHGVVVDAVRPGRVRGRGSLAIQVTSVTGPDGIQLRVSGTFVSTAPRPERLLPPHPDVPILVGMAAGYGTAALVSKVSSSAETIGRAGIIAGVSTGILVGVLKRGEDLVLPVGFPIDVILTRVTVQ